MLYFHRYLPLGRCLSRHPVDDEDNLVSWPEQWPTRSIPPSLNPDAEQMFLRDTQHWSALVSDVYLNAKAINWSSVRNIMDMNAGNGGCDPVDVAAEMDRIIRPGGYVLIQDTMEMIHKLTSIFGSLHWSTKLYQEQYLIGRKGFRRPS